MSFKTGDVVRLKSGGPRMTVSECLDELIVCDYFAGNELRHYDAEPEMLAPVWPAVICDQDESYGLYDADVENALGEYEALYCEEPTEMSDEELDALMYASELRQYGSSY